MASRAHVQDYYGFPSDRPRRPVRYPARDDSVLLPRDGSEKSANTVLMVSGLVATAIIAGGAFAVYAGVPPPPMAETATPALVQTYQLDDQPPKAQRFELLEGPAHAVPNVATASELAEETDTPALEVRTPPPEVRLEPAPVPRPRPIPAPAQTPPLPSEPDTPKQQLYPDPTTTPPDAIAPPGSNPELPLPLLDPENPYR